MLSFLPAWADRPRRVLLAVPVALAACHVPAADRAPSPAWRGKVRGQDHVLLGAEVVDYIVAEPRVEIVIPGSWRPDPQPGPESIQPPDLQLEFIAGGGEPFNPRSRGAESRVVVFSEGSDSFTSDMYAAISRGAAVYLIRQTPASDGYDLTISRAEGWPIELTKVGEVTWPAGSDADLAGFQPNRRKDIRAHGSGPILKRPQSLGGDN